MKSRLKHNGFTLFELLVTMSIIVLLSIMLTANLQKGEKQYQIQLAGQEIIQNIRRVQDMALTSFKYQGQEVPYFYGIYFDKNKKKSYIIFGDRNNNNTYQSSDIKIEEISIESGVEIDSLSSGNKDLNIAFSVPDGFTYIEPDDDSAVITIKRKGINCIQSPKSCKNIIVEKTGRVNIE